MKTKYFLSALALFLMALMLPAQDAGKQDKTPVKPALIVIDIQNAYLEYIPEMEKKIGMEYINELIDLFRSYGYPVIRVYHYSNKYGPEIGSEAFKFPSTVHILPSDPEIIKTYPDAFNKTDLDKVLKEKGSNTLFLCGLSSVGCVLASWIGAQNYDYNAYMVKNAIMSHNSEYTDYIEEIFDAVGFEMVRLVVGTAD